MLDALYRGVLTCLGGIGFVMLVGALLMIPALIEAHLFDKKGKK